MGKRVMDEPLWRAFRLPDRKIMVRTEEASHTAEKIAAKECSTGEIDT